MFDSFRTWPLLAASGLLLAGCSISEAHSTPDAGEALIVDDAGTPTTNVFGYGMDPEAFLLSVITWPCAAADCSDAPPPLAMASIPHTQRALVTGATASIVDPNSMQVVSTATVPSAQDGSWEVDNLQFGTRYYPALTDTSSAVEAPWGPPDFPAPIPPVNKYFKTVTVRPMLTSAVICGDQEAGAIGDTGVLAAAASAMGVTPADLVDPAKYDGVIVAWAYPSGPPFLRAPGFGSSFTVVGTSASNVYTMGWAPPGNGPPGQAPRGFFVWANGMGPPAGIDVIAIPHGTGGTPITITADPGDGTPASAPVTVYVQPGEVTFVPIQFQTQDVGLPPYFCQIPSQQPPQP